MRKLGIFGISLMAFWGVLFGIYCFAQWSDPAASDIQDADQAYVLGVKYQSGNYPFVDIDKSIAYLSKARELENFTGNSILASQLLLFKQEECGKVFKILLEKDYVEEGALANYVFGLGYLKEACELYSVKEAEVHFIESYNHGCHIAIAPLIQIYHDIYNDKNRADYWTNIMLVENLPPQLFDDGLLHLMKDMYHWYVYQLRQLIGLPQLKNVNLSLDYNQRFVLCSQVL